MKANPKVNGSPCDYFCPVCDKTLWTRKTGHKMGVWCPHFACPDNRMNDGAVGRTVPEAVARLIKIAGQSR